MGYGERGVKIVFFRKITTKKNGKEYVYVKLIENYRSEGKVKQRVIANFGSIENLSQERINYLMSSLKKLHNEIGAQGNETVIPSDLRAQVQTIKQALLEIKIKRTVTEIFGQNHYDLAEALIIKTIMVPEANNPIQEVCKSLGLIDAPSVQFYNAVKRLGEDDAKEAFSQMRLSITKGNENVQKLTFIYVFASNFEGTTFDVDIPGNLYLPQDYHKQLIMLMACDEEGTPVDYEFAEEVGDVEEQLEILVDRLKQNIQGAIIVLDTDNILESKSRKFLVAKQVQELPREAIGLIYFNTIRFEQKSELKIKEIKANLAKVSSGLETIKADVFLGKLNKESAVKKRADAVIKANGCQDMVFYSFNEVSQTFNYSINEEVLREKNQSVVTTTWQIEAKDKVLSLSPAIKTFNFKIDQFNVITDQLKIPPINMYVDYHYSPDVISGHIQLGIIKNQISVALNRPEQGGDA